LPVSPAVFELPELPPLPAAPPLPELPALPPVPELPLLPPPGVVSLSSSLQAANPSTAIRSTLLLTPRCFPSPLS
jgi:hypothetical protein